MRTFHDVIRDLLDRLRATPVRSFLKPDPGVASGEPLTPMRHLYRGEKSTWGQEGGYDPSQLPLPSGFETRVVSPPVSAPVPAPQRQPTIQVFRLFED